jgi:hypothetical protein
MLLARHLDDRLAPRLAVDMPGRVLEVGQQVGEARAARISACGSGPSWSEATPSITGS